MVNTFCSQSLTPKVRNNQYACGFIEKNFMQFHLAMPTACGSSWARDQTCATAATRDTAVATADLKPAAPQGNPPMQ